jgi:DNA polymerase-1
MTNRILLIDFMSLAHTTKFALAKTKLSKGEESTFIIYGFFLKLNFLLKKTRANQVVFALDSKTSKRKELYPEYKAKRKQSKTPAQIKLDKLAYPQFTKLTDEILPEIGYRNLFSVDGLEADDIIGSICKQNKNDQIIIVSSDKDMYQLLTNNVCMISPSTNKYYTISDFRNEYHIEPKIWKRVKSLGGCSSDQISGVPIPPKDKTKRQTHVGEKGALNYLTGKMKPNTKAFKAIESRAGKDVINRNKALVILPFRGTPTFAIRPDRLKYKKFLDICENLGFKSILANPETWKSILKLR